MKIKETFVALLLISGAMSVGSKAIASDFTTSKKSPSTYSQVSLNPQFNPNGFNYSFKQLGLSNQYSPTGMPYQIRNVQMSSNNDICEYLGIAISAFSSGDYITAKRVLDLIMVIDPNIGYAYVLRGLSFLMLESPVSAITNLEKGFALLKQENSEESQYLAELVKNLIPMVKITYSI
jgi:tetratricopeptide (TPR) repeat protein